MPERHILPADDEKVEDLTADIIDALSAYLSGDADIHESSETGEPVIALHAAKRRFRLQLIELPA